MRRNCRHIVRALRWQGGQGPSMPGNVAGQPRAHFNTCKLVSGLKGRQESRPGRRLRDQAPPWVRRATRVFALKGRENRNSRRAASRAQAGRWQFSGIKPRAALARASLPWAGFLSLLQAESPGISRQQSGMRPLSFSSHRRLAGRGGTHGREARGASAAPACAVLAEFTPARSTASRIHRRSNRRRGGPALSRQRRFSARRGVRGGVSPVRRAW